MYSYLVGESGTCKYLNINIMALLMYGLLLKNDSDLVKYSSHSHNYLLQIWFNIIHPYAWF
jgi:hypothetical protein